MKFFLCLIAIVFFSSAFAQEEINIKLWEKEQPTYKSTKTEAETMNAAGFVSDVTVGEIFVYLAKKENNCGKAAIICPGGSYAGVALMSEGKDCAKFLAENGITGIVLKYRVPNGNHLVPMEDVFKTFEIVLQNAEKWGVDKNEIGVIGFSAGGHLASTISVRKNPAFAVLFYPVISADEEIRHDWSFQCLTGGQRELMKYYSNELNVTPNTPPTLLFHSAEDEVVSVKNSIVYQAALAKNGVVSQLVIFPGKDHGWGMLPRLKQSEFMKATMISFIKNI